MDKNIIKKKIDENDFIQFIRNNKDSLDMTDSFISSWMNKMALQAQKEIIKLNKQFKTKQIIKNFEKLTRSKIDPSFTCFLPFYTDFGKNMKIGKNVFINKNCNFQDCGGIEIGDNCLIGMNVNIATLNHEIDFQKRSIIVPKKVVLEENVWIGSGVSILPGVTIGKNTIIAAGAVLTKDAQPNSIYAGVPAKKIRSI